MCPNVRSARSASFATRPRRTLLSRIAGPLALGAAFSDCDSPRAPQGIPSSSPSSARAPRPSATAPAPLPRISLYETVATRAGDQPASEAPGIEALLVGDGWGCARLQADDDVMRWQCWNAPGIEQPPGGAGGSLQAKRVPWLPLEVTAGPDRLCSLGAPHVRCWRAPEFMHAPAAEAERSTLLPPDTAFDGIASSGIAPGRWHTCAWSVGRSHCRGRGDVGQLGV